MIFRFRGERVDRDRIRLRMFVGPDADHLQLAGTLAFHVGEFQIFAVLMLLGLENQALDRRLKVEFPDDDQYLNVEKYDDD